MDPETPCKKCGHERKWHDPCSLCQGVVSTNKRSTPKSRCGGFQEPVTNG